MNQNQLTFVVGQYYKTRDGRRSEFIECRNGENNKYAVFETDGREVVHLSDGKLSHDFDCEDDIVGEWAEPKPLELEVGKFYEVENGEVGECMETDKFSFLVCFDRKSFRYYSDGRRLLAESTDYRIVREVPNPNQPAAVCEREVESEDEGGEWAKRQNVEDESEPETATVPFDFNLMTTEQFQQHLNETVKNKKAQRERNLFGAIARAHKGSEVVPSWILEEILRLRSEAKIEAFQAQFNKPIKESELQVVTENGRNFTELEVGGIYEDAHSRRVTIKSITDERELYPFKGSNGDTYTKHGIYNINGLDENRNLIRKIN